MTTERSVSDSGRRRLERSASFPTGNEPTTRFVEHDGAAVLLVGQEIVEQVKDTTIDYEEGGAGPDS
jgi:hypothetical protein